MKPPDPPTSSPAIEVSNLHVRFSGFEVLSGVTLQVPRGKMVAVIGPNGSGKTTLMRCLVGLQPPSAGRIVLLGEEDLRRALPRVGYVPQRLPLDRSFVLSVREFLALRLVSTRHWFVHRNRHIDGELEKLLPEIGLMDLLDRPLADLSGGQLQRVLIGYSLLHKPELLLLDEPTSGVDTPGEQTFYELIAEVHRSFGLTVMLISHDLSMVSRYASWVYALNGVICCQGPPDDVMNAESLKQAYGIHMTSYHHPHVH